MVVVPDLSFEKSLWEVGFVNIVGVDEAGKGPLAGPVTAGAVVVHSEKQVVSLVRDSKKMSPWQRERAFEEIRKSSSAFGIGIVPAQEIDCLGINEATRKAMLAALAEIVDKFKMEISLVLVDGSRTKELKEYPSRRIKAGDLYHYSISAASVLAKVTRDRMMKEFARQYPQYGFDQHVGYGTKSHLQALEKYGVCPIHRQNYLPVKRLLGNP